MPGSRILFSRDFDNKSFSRGLPSRAICVVGRRSRYMLDLFVQLFAWNAQQIAAPLSLGAGLIRRVPAFTRAVSRYTIPRWKRRLVIHNEHGPAECTRDNELASNGRVPDRRSPAEHGLQLPSSGDFYTAHRH